MFLEKKFHHILTSIATITALASTISIASAGINESIENALKFGQEDGKYGQINMDLNVRYENVTTENTGRKTAEAFTARLRLGYLTPNFHGFNAFAEFEANQDIAGRYSSSRNGRRRNLNHDIIQDPQDTELNRLWISFDGIPDTTIKVGRQRIKLDNDRFIGNVGWRQMEQTYDSVMLTNQSLPNTIIKVGFIDKVKQITSATVGMSSPIVNVSYNFEDIGKLTGYGYWLDYDNRATSRLSTQTYGVRFDGNREINKNFTAHYTLEFAHQSDYADNPNSYDVDYYNLMGGITAYGITFKGAIEQLGGQNGFIFTTPLATGHAFQGWADTFLVVQPPQGIRDVQGIISAKIMGTKIMGVYHDFTDESGARDYGEEYDFLVTRMFAKHYSLLAKYAVYNGDQFGVDTQKIWLQAGIHF